MTMTNKQIETSLKTTNQLIAQLASLMTAAMTGRSLMPKMPGGLDGMGSGKNPSFPLGNTPSWPRSRPDLTGTGSGDNALFGKRVNVQPRLFGGNDFDSPGGYLLRKRASGFTRKGLR